MCMFSPTLAEGLSSHFGNVTSEKHCELTLQGHIAEAELQHTPPAPPAQDSSHWPDSVTQ